MLPGRAIVNNSTFSQLNLKHHKLLVRAKRAGPMKKTNLVVSQVRVQKIEQISSANRVDQHRVTFHSPTLSRHAIPVTGNLNPDHAPPNRSNRDLGVSRIITEISDDESPAVILSINGRKCVRPRTSVEILRQFFELFHANQAGRKGTSSADHGRRTIFGVADIMRDDRWLKNSQRVAMHAPSVLPVCKDRR